jgi:benzoate-CoA ligase
MTATQIAAPGSRFNFTEHLMQLNSARLTKIAFIDDQGRLSYGELFDRVRSLAQALQASGIRREERVLLLMSDQCDWPVCFLACLYAGIVPVAVNTLMTASDYAYMLQHSRAQAALVSAPLLATLQAAMALGDHEVRRVIVSQGATENSQFAIEAPHSAAEATAQAAAQATLEAMIASCLAGEHGESQPAPTAADDPAFWLYSSGSTGRPKGTVHTQGNLYWTAELYGKAVLGLNSDDVCFSAAKLFFAYGLGNGLSFPLSVGATVILMPERPTPAAVFKRWIEHRPTVFFGAPTGFAGMLAAPDLPSKNQVALRMCSSAGEALPADLGKRFSAQFGCDIIDGIGSTEMLHVFLSNHPCDVRYGTTGKPVAGYELALRDDLGQPVADGEIGDLYIKGPSAALLYWGNREKTRETFQGAWTKSGDKYVRDSDGYYTYSGRSDDMLKVSGVYVSPFEVEATLMQHPSVLEAAVVGKEDADGLTKTKAFVVLKAGHSTDEVALKAFVKDRLAPYKYPRQIEFIAELPKTATGKIQRYKLREG